MRESQKKCIVKIGTSGYKYEDWRGVFYPENLAAANMLEYYTSQFNIVEINATYYTIPNRFTFQRLAEKTPDHFQFIIKTNQETTHRRRENEEALRKLLEAVRPLIDTTKFEGLLAQFPYSFKNNEQNRKYLWQTKKIIGDIPLFVEFRNSSWLNPHIVAFLSDNQISYVNVDEPTLKGLLPPQEITSTALGYIRFHGRNNKEWWDGKGSARYNYEYKKDEMQEWLIHISNILRKTFKTYIFFNNHPTGKAVTNAKQMIELLKAQNIKVSEGASIP